MTTPASALRRIACIGTGIMGGHLARRLATAGFEVAGWNRTQGKVDALQSAGVRVATRVDDALADADAVVVMLSSGPVVDEVLFGPDVPLARLRRGTLVIVMSSIPVETARAQAAT